MKMKNKSHYLMMAVMVAIVAVVTWSCNKDDDPSLADLREDKLQYLEDSLRISDSLKRVNAAGIVNYAISVVNGSTSSLYKNGNPIGRTAATQGAVEGAIVTISQYGKILKDTTDASGMVVFNGFFRTSVNVTIEKTGFTTAQYIAATSLSQATSNNSISFVGNIIPIFETTGANTSVISGRATIQTNLTNKTRELAPQGTTLIANIDTKTSAFASRFLTYSVDNLHQYASTCGCEALTVGEVLEAAYHTNFIGTVGADGNYSITVPSAIDGLPTALTYSDVAADQTLFELVSDGDPFDRVATYRTIYEGKSYTPSAINAAGGVTVSFDGGGGAEADAVLTLPETVDRIHVTNGGSNYSGTPIVTVTGGNGTGATATAVVTNGVITAVNLGSAGTGYTTAPTVNIISGINGAASATLATDGTVTGVAITNTGAGYVTPPTVTIAAPGGPGTTATATATIDAAGRVTAVTITAPGSGYTNNPTVTFSASPTGQNAVGSGIYSGRSVATVAITNVGQDYTYAPAVTFSLPERAGGTRATGTAQFDPTTRTLTGITIVNAGSGYTAAPTVTIDAGSGASAEALLTGGSVLAIDITDQGSGYIAAPPVIFSGGDGSGATGTAVIADGKVIGINITNPGSGYTTPPTITIVDPAGASGFVTVTNGVVTNVTMVHGGSGYMGAPRVTFNPSGFGSGATGTATVAGGQITGVTVSSGGTGYIDGNNPAGTGENFSATKGNALDTKTGLRYINDVYYGTGVRQPN